MVKHFLLFSGRNSIILQLPIFFILEYLEFFTWSDIPPLEQLPKLVGHQDYYQVDSYLLCEHVTFLVIR